MKILVIGSGGREHAIVSSIANSKKDAVIYCAPGNGGISDVAKIIPIKPDNIKGLVDFAINNKIDLTVVGPELPLSLGIVDEFNSNGLRIFGPDNSASLFESSKQYTKDFLKRNGIKTADYKCFTEFNSAVLFAGNKSHPIVIKASGLAAGKGVFISKNLRQSKEYLDLIFNKKIFGSSGDIVVIEDFIDGVELSYMIVTDGEVYKPLATSMDYKKIFDGDKGENTGGMGAISPHPFMSAELEENIKKTIIEPVLNSFKKEGIIYKGILYAGLMIKGKDIYVLEFNVRFGDPETQAILIRLKSDIIDLFESCIDGRLKDYNLEFDENRSICLVMASKGYPFTYEIGYEISFAENYNESLPSDNKNFYIFHSGTKKVNGKYYTAGGRVLNLCAKGADTKLLIDAVYIAAEKTKFKNSYYRHDIGKNWIE
jgi:phosphoribosylamine--glycine ligase